MLVLSYLFNYFIFSIFPPIINFIYLFIYFLKAHLFSIANKKKKVFTFVLNYFLQAQGWTYMSHMLRKNCSVR